MSSLVFDIETNGLLHELTTIHCMWIYDIENDVYTGYTDKQTGYKSLKEGIKALENADTLIGHNIIKFDIPAIEKLYPEFKPKGKIIDTLILSKLVYPEIAKKDIPLVRKRLLPQKLQGSYKLEAFGYRLKEFKGEYGKQENAWDNFTPEMMMYNKQDVVVTQKLYHCLTKKENIPDNVLDLEQKFAKILSRQEQRGVLFNKQKAIELAANLVNEKCKLEDKLQGIFPPQPKLKLIPKRDNKAKGYIKDVPVYENVPFNPSSRIQVVERLKAKYNWQPEIFTEKGNPKIDEDVLNALPYPECKPLADLFKINKTLAMINGSKESSGWLNNLDEFGAIHGYVDTIGAVTRRCTHSKPNLAQTPAIEKDGDGNIITGLKGGYGLECRSLFGARDGFKFVGADASGLELRMLAHYLNCEHYTKEILTGDIHTKNQKLAGLETRAKAKRFIYAYNYGGGDKLIGEIAGVTEQETKLYLKDKRYNQVKQKLISMGIAPKQELILHTLKGKDVKQKFLQSLPELKKLIANINNTLKKRNYLYSLDKSKLTIRESYRALNALLQSAGAIVMKKALCILYDECVKRGWIQDTYYIRPDDKVYFVLNIHDEIQAEVKEKIAKEYAKIVVQSIKQAGVALNCRCPLDGEAKIGNTWADTH